jgi:hypothetical protein
MKSEEPQQNASLFFSLENPVEATFMTLPEWLRKKITGRILENKPQADPFDDVLPGDPDDDSSVPF